MEELKVFKMNVECQCGKCNTELTVVLDLEKGGFSEIECPGCNTKWLGEGEFGIWENDPRTE